MSQERLAELIPPSAEGISLQFSEGARVVQIPNAVFIYEPSSTRRYVVSQHRSPAAGIQRRLELQGITTGGKWHTMMEAYEAEGNDSGIIVHGLSERVEGTDGNTRGTAKRYSTLAEGTSQSDQGYKYFGDPETVAYELREMHALVVSTEELPAQIDVPATVEQLIVSFRSGSFDPPQLVLPQNQKIT